MILKYTHGQCILTKKEWSALLIFWCYFIIGSFELFSSICWYNINKIIVCYSLQCECDATNLFFVSNFDLLPSIQIVSILMPILQLPSLFSLSCFIFSKAEHVVFVFLHLTWRPSISLILLQMTGFHSSFSCGRVLHRICNHIFILNQSDDGYLHFLSSL